jgi:hypothetical protein
VTQNCLDGFIVYSQSMKVGGEAAAEGVPSVPIRNRSDNAAGEVIQI